MGAYTRVKGVKRIVATYVTDGDPIVDLLEENEITINSGRRLVPEMKVFCNDISTCALIDTGSQVSAIDENLLSVIREKTNEIPALRTNLN